ncbi:universal stress protein [Amycolatopsis sp. NPDC004368]
MPGTGVDNAIVVGIDASEPSLAAVRWAADEAVRRGSVLRVVHAAVFDEADLAPRERAHGDESALLLEPAHRWLQRAEAVARQAAPGVRVESPVCLGLAVELLIELSEDVPLVVLGSHGLGGLRGADIGSVALRVAASARCTVVVVRGPPRNTGPVVVGVGPETEDERVLAFALETAAGRGVPLLAVRVRRDVLWCDELVQKEPDVEAERALASRLSGWIEKYPSVATRALLVRDRSTGHALLDAAPDAQLIVVGTRGRGPVSGGLLGSTGNRLLAHAPCPVAVAR